MNRILNNRNKLNYHPDKKHRRANKDPMSQGKLKEITRLYVIPFLYMKAPETAMEPFLEQLFLTESRKIERFKAHTPFIMPGRVIDLPLCFNNKGAAGYTKVKRHVEPEQVMWIRTDTHMPDRIDVELVYKNGQSTTYKLDQAQYTVILQYLLYHPYKCHKSTERVNKC